MLRTSLFAVLLGIVLSSAHASNVLVVAPSGAPFTQIQPAIDAAQHGDVVLVKEGSYAAFAIVDKEVAVVADTDVPVHVTHASVTNLAASRDVLLHRLRLDSTGVSAYGLQADACAGSVRVQASRIEGGWSSGFAVATSPDVALTDCVLIGGDGSAGNWVGGSGVEAVSSQVAMYGGELRGGPGMSSCHGRRGGHGLSLKASYGFAADALLLGGAGGNVSNAFFENFWPSAGSGGDGARIEAAASVPSHLDWLADLFAGGVAGSANHLCGCSCDISPCCTPDPGVHGQPIFVASGGNSQTALPGLSPRLEVATNPVREQGLVALTFFGQPGDLVALMLGSETSFTPKAEMKGVRIVERQGLPLSLIVGTIGSSGMLTHAWTLGDLGAGVQSRIVHMQSFHRNAAGHFVLGNPVHLVELDQAF